MLEDKGSALGRVTLEAGFVVAEQPSPAPLERLGHVRSAPFDRVSLVRVVAIGATHFPFQHWMMMRQLEFGPHLRVALEAGGGGFSRINNQAALAAALDVQTSGTVTRFAPNVLGVVAFRFQPRMGRGREIARNRLVTGRAFARSDKFGAGNARGRQNSTTRFKIATREEYDGQSSSSPDHPPESFALTVDPSS